MSTNRVYAICRQGIKQLESYFDSIILFVSFEKMLGS